MVTLSKALGKETWIQNVGAYAAAYQRTLGWFRRNKLIPQNIDEIDEKLKRKVTRNGKKVEVLKEWRWKGEWIPLEYVNIMVGPHVRSMAGFMSRQYIEKIRDQSWKSYFATEIPACSVKVRTCSNC